MKPLDINTIKVILLASILVALVVKKQPEPVIINAEKIIQYENKTRSIDQVYSLVLSDSITNDQQDSLIAAFRQRLDRYRRKSGDSL